MLFFVAPETLPSRCGSYGWQTLLTLSLAHASYLVWVLFLGWASPARRWRRTLAAAPEQSMRSAAWFVKVGDLKSDASTFGSSRPLWRVCSVCQPWEPSRSLSAWPVGLAWCARSRVLVRTRWPDISSAFA